MCGRGLPSNRLKKMCHGWMDWTGSIITALLFSRVSRIGSEIFGILEVNILKTMRIIRQMRDKQKVTNI